jgi:hypothetical protein
MLLTLNESTKFGQPTELESIRQMSSNPAPGGWFNCQVGATGPASDVNLVCIWLTDLNGQFDGWYVSDPTLKEDALATALTAIATGNPVTVSLNTTDQYGTVQRIYIYA